MSDPLWVTKVSLPLLRQVLVPRIKALRQLSEGLADGHLLTLVSAPAGYGKTTTVRMWVEQAGYPVAWVTLGKSENDLGRFLEYFLTAIGQLEDGLGHAALEAVENSREVEPERVLGLVINDLYELDRRVLLVIEEYQQIENDKIDRFLESILNQAIKNLHLIITTREDPNLPLTRLRVRNQLTEIRAKDLCFSPEETGDFFSRVMRVNLSTEESKILWTRTEGWAAGLQLAALSLKESDDRASQVKAFRGTHRHVLDYLIQEVLASQPEEIREFLRRTSILDELSPPLCDAVTGQQAGAQYLRYLDSSNLFLAPLNQERTWYRYHALFADLLRNQLAQVEPEMVDLLHERAADWFNKNGFVQRAVEHAFQTSNGMQVTALIEQHAVPMLYQGEVSVVMDWFDRLPESSMQASPMICISKAWAVALMQHETRTQEVERILQTADLALKRSDADKALQDRIAGHAASIQAYLLQSSSLVGNEPNNLIETSKKAQQLLPVSEKGIRSVNNLNIAYGYAALADLPAAEQACEQAFEDGIAGGNFYAAIYGRIDLLALKLIKGELKDARRLCETSIDRFNRILAGQRFPPIGDLYSIKGILFLEENRLKEAEEALMQGSSLVHLTREPEAHLRCHSGLARLHSIQGDRMAMLTSIQALEEIGPECAGYAETLRHRLLVRDPTVNRADVEQAERWAAQTGFGSGAMPDIDRLDLACRILFQSYVSAAHILTRLATQTPDDYSLTNVHTLLDSLERFATAHGLLGWLVEIWVVRALMFSAQANVNKAHDAIRAALSASAQRGYIRIFLDEADLLRPLLESIEPRLQDSDLSAFVKRLLEAMPADSAKHKPITVDQERLSDREIQVLELLAAGQTYKEIGQKLFLSLNTVQFHVKNIYSKLGVNKRGQAIDQAREKGLIRA